MITLRGVDLAVVKAGGVTALARHLGTTRQVVQHWLHQGYAPLNRVVEIEAEYGVDRRVLANPRVTERVGV